MAINKNLNVGSGFDMKAYAKARRKLVNAIEMQQLDDLKSSLEDFESYLKTDEMKTKERRILIKAHEDKEYLEKLRKNVYLIFFRTVA